MIFCQIYDKILMEIINSFFQYEGHYDGNGKADCRYKILQ